MPQVDGDELEPPALEEAAEVEPEPEPTAHDDSDESAAIEAELTREE